MAQHWYCDTCQRDYTVAYRARHLATFKHNQLEKLVEPIPAPRSQPSRWLVADPTPAAEGWGAEAEPPIGELPELVFDDPDCYFGTFVHE